MEENHINKKPYHVKISPMNENGTSPYSYSFRTDEQYLKEMESKFTHVVKTYQDAMKSNPVALKIEIEDLKMKTKNEYCNKLIFSSNHTFTVEGWNTYRINGKEIPKHMDLFMIEQTIYGHIYLALDRKDEKAFNIYTNLLKELNYKTYL